jgi:hypothetical protein
MAQACPGGTVHVPVPVPVPVDPVPVLLAVSVDPVAVPVDVPADPVPVPVDVSVDPVALPVDVSVDPVSVPVPVPVLLEVPVPEDEAERSGISSTPAMPLHALAPHEAKDASAKSLIHCLITRPP